MAATAMIVAPSTPPMPHTMQETTEPAAAAPAVAVSPSPSPPHADHNGIGQYHFLRTLGRGSSGTVKLAWHKLTHAEVAIKIVYKKLISKELLARQHREVHIMKKLQHPHIVRLYEVFESDEALYLVLEYVPCGELYDYLISRGRMKEKEARTKFLQVMSALLYCHSRRIVHRDLKAENILVDAHLNLKVVDFGLSNEYSSSSHLKTFCGSAPYAAPEMFHGAQYTGPEVDIWSLGVLLYAMCTSALPFDGNNLKEMRRSVIRGEYVVPDYISPGLRSFLGCLLVVDKTKRRSLMSFVDHPWLNEDGPARERLLAMGLPATVLVPRPVAHASSSDDHGRSISSGSLLTLDEDLATAVATRLNIDRGVVVADVLNNLYNDVTAVYKLMQLDRSHFVAGGGKPSTSPESRHTHHSHHQHHHDPAPPSSTSATSSDASTPSTSSFSSSANSRSESVAIVLSEPTPQPMPPRAVLPRRTARLAPLPSDGELVLPAVDRAASAAAAAGPATTIPDEEPRRITVVSSPAAESMAAGEHLWSPSANASEQDHDLPGTIPDPVAMPRPLPTLKPGDWDWARHHARGMHGSSGQAPRSPPVPAATAGVPPASAVVAGRPHSTFGADTAFLPSAAARAITAQPRSGKAIAAAPSGQSPATPAMFLLKHRRGSAVEATTALPAVPEAPTPPAPAPDALAVTTGRISPPVPTPSRPALAATAARIRRISLTAVGWSGFWHGTNAPTSVGIEQPPGATGPAPDAQASSRHEQARPKTSSLPPSPAPIFPSQPAQPRVLNFGFSSTTTSSKPPAEIFREVTRVCEKHNISVEQVGPFTLRLQSPECAVELEVCRIRLLFDLYGLVPKRVAGTGHVYKKVCHSILADLHL